MSANQLKRRSNPKPFVKVVNFNHILPTRFQVTGEFSGSAGKELKSMVTEDRLASAESRKTLKKEVRTIFRERYNAPDQSNEKQPAVDFFFQKLRTIFRERYNAPDQSNEKQ